MNPYALQIARLEEEVEYWRQRAEKAELALRGGVSEPGKWGDRVLPLSLLQTRLMRLLAVQAMTSKALQLALRNDYPRISDGSIKAHFTQVRSVLPANIAPPRGAPCPGTLHHYTIPDRPALAEFLATGQLPLRRAA
jgi:hypothetical protein